MKRLATTLASSALVLGFIVPAHAYDFGSGPGCSAIAGVDATRLTAGDTFTGRIGRTGVTGLNPRGKPVDNWDGDAFTNSLEECINDALLGYCTTLYRDDTGVIEVVPGPVEGRRGEQQWFTVTFLDPSACGISQCSNHQDDDGDGFADYPADPYCRDYDDHSEYPLEGEDEDDF